MCSSLLGHLPSPNPGSGFWNEPQEVLCGTLGSGFKSPLYDLIGVNLNKLLSYLFCASFFFSKMGIIIIAMISLKGLLKNEMIL